LGFLKRLQARRDAIDGYFRRRIFGGRWQEINNGIHQRLDTDVSEASSGKHWHNGLRASTTAFPERFQDNRRRYGKVIFVTLQKVIDYGIVVLAEQLNQSRPALFDLAGECGIDLLELLE
jgi:hypothetical protein